ncbi:MAG: ferric reductase-like transmembrane domain-containing protein [Acidimicrobiaceae bacterium]|nr:ferric reductase-like transmembrane domain-containing protein [Acidimicrobiaceae bacterium]
MNSQALWYLVRSTGLIDLVLLSAAMVLGVAEVVRWVRPGWPRFVVAALHRNLSLLAVAVLAVHVVTTVADSFVNVALIDAFVPFVGTYQPFWLGMGALSLDLMVALVITSALRSRLGRRGWRAVHWTAYLCWPVAVAHGLGMGTDTGTRWVDVLYALCVGAVVLAALWRLAVTWQGISRPGRPHVHEPWRPNRSAQGAGVARVPSKGSAPTSGLPPRSRSVTVR